MNHHVATFPHGTPVRLSAGAHSSPGEGMCVVELASMIAGEEFSDRPLCVCPVIGAFLRGWNDRASHAERQRLAPYAPRIVGSRADPQVTQERREMSLEWAGAGPRGNRGPSVLSEVSARLRMAILCGLDAALRPDEGAGELAARAAFARGDTQGALELLEALLSAGDQRRPEARRPVSGGNGRARTNGHGQLPADLSDKRQINRGVQNGSRAPELDPLPSGNGSPPSELARVGALGNGLANGAARSNGNGSFEAGAAPDTGTHPTPARRAP